MKKIVLLVGVVFFTANIFSQVSYRVEYDKPSDKFTYKKIVFESNGEKKEIDLKGKLPKLNQGDNVIVEVTNYNPFLYYVTIEEEEMIVSTGKKSNAFGLLSLMSGGIAPITSFVSNLSSIQTDLSNRGAEPLATNESELELYSIETKTVTGLIQDYQKKYESYQRILSQIESENLQQEIKSIVGKLEEVYRNYYNPTDKIEMLSSSSKFHFNKAGILDNKLKETANTFDYQLNKFKELLANPSNTYTRKGIEEWITKLKNAEFSSKKSFTVSSTESKLFTVANAEEDELKQEALVGIKYKIKFYRLKDLKEIINSEDTEFSPNYVRYYYENKYWNSKGQIVDTLCEDCAPVLKAEGLYRDQAPRYFEKIFDDEEKMILSDAAIGKWIFYSPDGKISRIILEPESEPIRKIKKSEINKEDLSQVFSVVKTVDIPVKKGIIMNWATGLYSLGSFKERNSYFSKINSTMDSVTIGQTGLTRSRICIGSQMVFDFQGNKLITPSLNLGAAVDFWDERDIHFLVGGGMKFKQFPYLSLSAGLAFTRVNVLNKPLQVGQTYDVLKINGDIQTKKYLPGYFVGLNISF
jgi:hypothetical protein